MGAVMGGRDHGRVGPRGPHGGAVAGLWLRGWGGSLQGLVQYCSEPASVSLPTPIARAAWGPSAGGQQRAPCADRPSTQHSIGEFIHPSWQPARKASAYCSRPPYTLDALRALPQSCPRGGSRGGSRSTSRRCSPRQTCTRAPHGWVERRYMQAGQGQPERACVGVLPACTVGVHVGCPRLSDQTC